MRSISVQVQPARSPGIDIARVSEVFETIAANSSLVKHHAFESDKDKGSYFNFTFGTPNAKGLWQLIERELYMHADFGPHMRRASMAMCSSESGWEDYLLLYHFDPAVKRDACGAL